MEFWGVEVKNGETLKVSPGKGKVVHISQAAIGEIRGDIETGPVYLHLIVDNQKFVLGTLSYEKFPQITLEVVLEKGFELSHCWKDGSVYFSGYKVHTHDEMPGADEDIEDELPLLDDNGKTGPKAKEAKTEPTKAEEGVKKQVSFKEPNKGAKPDQEGDNSDEVDDTSSAEESGEDEGREVTYQDDMDESSNDEDDDDDSDDDESSDEETPKKPEPSKTRPAEPTLRSLANDKKTNVATPQKNNGKRSGGHIATPHPVKQAGKKPSNSEHPRQQTNPKPSGSYPCKSCNRSFTSEMGLQSHTKAKHGAAQ